MRLSVGIPVFNEREVIGELLRRLTSVLDRIPGGPHQIVFVDDGSSDGSLELLRRAAHDDPRISVIVLSRNFGHQAALGAALDHASGDAVVLMDADLQDEPEVIPSFVSAHQAGTDVVFARRASREEGVALRTCDNLFYRLVGSLAEVPLPRDAGDFALLDKRVVAALRRLPEQQRYLRGLRAWIGFRQTGIDVERPARFAGRPKYTVWKLTKLALDGICSFSVVPLRAASLCGVLAIGLAGAFSVYAVYVRLAGGAVPQGFTATLVVSTFLGGVQLFFLGVIGEYLGRVYGEAKKRPAYVIAEIVGNP
jgi:polyisoprenyl-phosphate glycosyltransferase